MAYSDGYAGGYAGVEKKFNVALIVTGYVTSTLTGEFSVERVSVNFSESVVEGEL